MDRMTCLVIERMAAPSLPSLNARRTEPPACSQATHRMPALSSFPLSGMQFRARSAGSQKYRIHHREGDGRWTFTNNCAELIDLSFPAPAPSSAQGPVQGLSIAIRATAPSRRSEPLPSGPPQSWSHASSTMTAVPLRAEQRLHFGRWRSSSRGPVARRATLGAGSPT